MHQKDIIRHVESKLLLKEFLTHDYYAIAYFFEKNQENCSLNNFFFIKRCLSEFFKDTKIIKNPLILIKYKNLKDFWAAKSNSILLFKFKNYIFKSIIFKDMFFKNQSVFKNRFLQINIFWRFKTFINYTFLL